MAKKAGPVHGPSLLCQVVKLDLSQGRLLVQLVAMEGRTALGIWLGLSIAGLMLVEQLLRRIPAEHRWGIKPLCLGLAAMFGFDLFLFADSMLFGQLGIAIWVARGAAHALVIPLIAIATARTTAWTIELHISRGVAFHSTALLLSGVFLLIVASAGYIAQYVGGEWGRVVQIEILFSALLAFAFAAVSGTIRAKIKVFVTKHWVDAEWVMPAAAVNRVGTEHVVNTHIFRHTDRQPLANYHVRYRILDGPPAFFLPSRTSEFVATSDLSGNAAATMAQSLPQPGINRISVEIIRPPGHSLR